jgi:uncharacterized membrane protein required for colicin V production
VKVVVDIAAILLILLNVFLGWRYGLLRRTIAFAGLFGGIAAASFAGNSISSFFRGSGKPSNLYDSATTYLLVVSGVLVMLEILGALYGDRVRDIVSLAFDRSVGAIAGAFVGFLEIGVICLVMLAVGDSTSAQTGQVLPADRGRAASAVRDGWIGGRIAGSEDFVSNIFSPALPSNLGSHLAEAAK